MIQLKFFLHFFAVALGVLLLTVPSPGLAQPSVHFYYWAPNPVRPEFPLRVEASSTDATCKGFVQAYFPTSPYGKYVGPRVVGIDRSEWGTTHFTCGYQKQGVDTTFEVGTATCGDYDTRGDTGAFVDSTNWTCACLSGQRFMSDVQRCVQLYAEPPLSDPGKSVGPTCDRSCGEPINPTNGNMWHKEIDYSIPSSSPLLVERTYNSLPESVDATAEGSFGARWTHAYGAQLRAEAAVAAGAAPVQCFRRHDNSAKFCERPPVPDAVVPDAVSISRPDGKRYHFNRKERIYVSTGDVSDRVEPSYGSDGKVTAWTYTAAAGDQRERYNATGQLVAITARNGAVQSLTYTTGTSNDSRVARQPSDSPVCPHIQAGEVLPAGKLLCVTDHWGKQLQFEYDPKGRIKKLIDPANQVTEYEYDGPTGGCLPHADQASAPCVANNLTKVTYPDGKSRTYAYNELSNIGEGKCSTTSAGAGLGHLANAMTGLIDENGAPYIRWTYDCYGKATSSELAGGVEKVVIDYRFGNGYGDQADVTHIVGSPVVPAETVSRFSFRNIQGRLRDTGSSNQCVECGPFSARTFDANGNVATTTDWNGNITRHTYDLARNLELTRLDAAGTTLERQTTTEWHPVFRLPMKVAEPKRLTSYKRDAKGNVLTRTEQATTDDTGKLAMAATLTGSARVWTYTYNTAGQIESIRGPRTDMADLTRYAYDAQGNLSTVTDALQRVTTMSAYDANGRVGRVETPNGVVTTFDYDPRGRMLTKTVRAGSGVEVTRFDYDGVGQLKKISLPDRSVVTYEYDDAHRLIGISDALGNRIDYTLDLTGNRLQEKTIDPNGALARQVSRVFDTLGMLTQQVGRPQ